MSKLKLKINVNVPQFLCIVVSVALNGEFERFCGFCVTVTKNLPQFWANKHSSATGLNTWQYSPEGGYDGNWWESKVTPILYVTLSINPIAFADKVRIDALLSSLPIPNIVNKSSSSAFRPALSNLWLLLVLLLFFFCAHCLCRNFAWRGWKFSWLFSLMTSR